MLGEFAISISSVRPSPSWYRGTGQLQLLSWLAQAGSLSSEGSLAAVLVLVLVLVSTMIYTSQQLACNKYLGWAVMVDSHILDPPGSVFRWCIVWCRWSRW